MNLNSFNFLLDIHDPKNGNVAVLFQCLNCGAVVGEINHSVKAREAHISWHVRNGE